MEVPEDPSLQEYVPPPDAESVAISPAQIKVVPVIDGVGAVRTFTDALAVSVQLPIETITEYVEVVVGEIIIEEPEVPLLHK